MKWIIVTGDTGGLGHSVVKRLLEYTEFGVIGLSRKTTETTTHMIEKYNNRYKHFNFDLSHPESVKELYFEKLRLVGRFYGLVNNAANAYDDIVTNLQLDKLEWMYRVNVFSPMIITKYVLRDMLVNGTKGSIVHISSVSAHTGYKGLAMYASSKGALESFSKGVAREWGERGIRSNVVVPGFMETDISAKLTDEQRVKIYNRTSLKKATDVDSVADTVRFLLSGEAKSITGSIIFVDNGTI